MPAAASFHVTFQTIAAQKKNNGYFLKVNL